MLNLFKLDWGTRGCSIKCLHPDHFFVLSFPVLTDRIFLYPTFTHRIASIYSNIIAPTENKQRTVKSPFFGVFCIDPLKILCLVRSLVLSKRLFRNHIESNTLQKHTAKITAVSGFAERCHLNSFAIDCKSTAKHIIEKHIISSHDRVAAGNVRFIDKRCFSAMDQGKTIPEEIFWFPSWIAWAICPSLW